MKIGYSELNRYNLFIIIILMDYFYINLTKDSLMCIMTRGKKGGFYV